MFRERVAELRPPYLPADPCQRTEYRPGALAQWDLWLPEPRIPLGHGQEAMLPVVAGVSGLRPDADLCRALKAPSLAAAVQRLGERASEETWSHAECLRRDVIAHLATLNFVVAPDLSPPGRGSAAGAIE